MLQNKIIKTQITTRKTMRKKHRQAMYCLLILMIVIIKIKNKGLIKRNYI